MIGQWRLRLKRKKWTVPKPYEVDEGLCVQIMHHGPFDDEPATVAIMDKFLEDNGYRNDFSDGRLHHEIYMSDARKVAPEKWMTVIRHPICKKEV